MISSTNRLVKSLTKRIAQNISSNIMLLIVVSVLFSQVPFSLYAHDGHGHSSSHDNLESINGEKEGAKKQDVQKQMVKETFVSFQKLINRFYRERLTTDGGFESAFDYVKASKNPETKKLISKQLEILKTFKVSSLVRRDQAIAFWVNTYNFLMVAKVMKDGFESGELKIKSVKDLGNFIDRYKAFKQKDFTVDGVKLSLDEIEKGILLGKAYKKKGWKDARIHFAVNCASVGCPPLTKNVYTELNLSPILDENIRRALKTKRHFHFSKDGKVLHLTSLFKWYKKDFVEQSGGVKEFLAEFENNENNKIKILAAKNIEFIDYDWKLNLPKNFGF